MLILTALALIFSSLSNPESLTPAQYDSLHQKMENIFLQQNIPGAAVVWVQQDRTLYLETFGYANIEESRPVHPERTIFRVASISKPFTAIGVLNLVEKGLLNLGADINSLFAKPLINDKFEGHVTLHHLLTHTAGFDDKFIGKSARTREDALSLKEVAETMLPRRFIEPGEIASYSNFGVALAGYLAEHASGIPFPELMDQNVFQPLGMHRSSFDPDDAELREFMTGYLRANQTFEPFAYDHINDSPAGMMVSTAEDMARFMKAILREDGLEEAGILSQSMTREMLSVRFTHHRALTGGFGYLWNHTEFNGQSVINHDGGYPGSAARLFLFPEHGAALFIAVNIMEFGFLEEVLHLFVNTFLPQAEIIGSIETVGNYASYNDGRPLTDFAATWRNTRYTRYSFTKFAALLGILSGELTTQTEGDSLLTMPTHTGDIRRMVRVEPLLFQSIDDDYRIAFREADGKITHLFTNGSTAFEKLHPLETAAIQLPFLLFCNFFFTALILIYFMIYVVQKYRFKQYRPERWFISECIIAGVYTFHLLFTSIAFLQIPPHEMMIGFGYGLPASFYIATLIPYLGLAASVWLVWLIISTKEKRILRSGWSVLIVIISLGYFFSLVYWKQTGWHF